ncbi:MAG: hypothetical protein ACRDTC_03900 [Pseudonocardiaceae bacterium]
MAIYTGEAGHCGGIGSSLGWACGCLVVTDAISVLASTPPHYVALAITSGDGFLVVAAWFAL